MQVHTGSLHPEPLRAWSDEIQMLLLYIVIYIYMYIYEADSKRLVELTRAESDDVEYAGGI